MNTDAQIPDLEKGSLAQTKAINYSIEEWDIDLIRACIIHQLWKKITQSLFWTEQRIRLNHLGQVAKRLNPGSSLAAKLDYKSNRDWFGEFEGALATWMETNRLFDFCNAWRSSKWTPEWFDIIIYPQEMENSKREKYVIATITETYIGWLKWWRNDLDLSARWMWEHFSRYFWVDDDADKLSELIKQNFSAIKRSIEEACTSKWYVFLDITHTISSHATRFANAESQAVTDKVVGEVPDIGVLPRTKWRVQQSRRSVRAVLDTHFERAYPADIVHLVIFVPVKEST